MEDKQIPVLEALELTTKAIKDYTDGQSVVSYGKSQYLSAMDRAIAKNNIGVYVGPDEPTNAVNGDIWCDTDAEGSNIVVDKTLTKDGQAADAKIVGEALASKQPVGNYALVDDIPNVPDWAMAATKPTYTAAEVGALPASTSIPRVEIDTTLSVANKAADAKAVGDELAKKKLLIVTLDENEEYASHSASEINAHLNNGGSVVLEVAGSPKGYATLYLKSNDVVWFAITGVTSDLVKQDIFSINNEKVCSYETLTFEGAGSGGEAKTPLQRVVTTKNGTQVGIDFFYTDGTASTAVIVVDENDTPLTITENGNTTTFEWSGL